MSNANRDADELPNIRTFYDFILWLNQHIGKFPRNQRFTLLAVAAAPDRARIKSSYVPSPYRTFTIYDRKPRLIHAAPFGDRVVHHALGVSACT